MATMADGRARASSSKSKGLKFLDLPDCMIEQVLEYLSYDEIAKKRIVCRKIDRICQSLLNRGFIKMMRRHNMHLKAIKSQLPRRESERRNHPLAKHSDILTCIETRISMLSMTYTKFIERELCCFIPGKVIDEVLTILGLIENTSRPLRAHEVLQELRDISSMAIEHFDENIAHRLKKIIGVHHHPTTGAHHHLTFPAVGFTQNEVIPPCDVSENCMMPRLAPISSKPPKPSLGPPATQCGGPISGLYCHTSCTSSRVNSSAIVRINRKSRKMRCDINRIDHTISSFKLEMRSMRLLLMRQSLEMKELRRRLEESEMKNLDLLANINQLGFGAPSVGSGTAGGGAAAAATINQCNIKPRASAPGILKRFYPGAESHTSVAAVPTSSFVTHTVPSFLETAPASSEENYAAQNMGRSVVNAGASTSKKVRFMIRGCKQYNSVVGYDDPLVYFPTADFLHVGRTPTSRYFRIAVVASNDGILRFGETFFPYDRNVIEIVLGGWANMQSAGRRQFRTASNRNSNTQLTLAKTPYLLSPFRPVMFVLEVFNDGAIEVRIDGQGVIGGWANTKSAGRRQHRSASNHVSNILLTEAQTPNILSPYKPEVFVVEVFNNGTVQVLIDGQTHPFLSFYDEARIPPNYVAFTKTANHLMYFYDCPLNQEPTATIGGEDSVLLRCSLA
uniref:F-box domain-containing protein n=1 Tax=Anopheles farauti TaxID=69004 RepID=A0A182QRM0_9DIPT